MKKPRYNIGSEVHSTVYLENNVGVISSITYTEPTYTHIIYVVLWDSGYETSEAEWNLSDQKTKF